MPKETVASVLEQAASPTSVPGVLGAVPAPVPVSAEEMTGLPSAEPGQTVHGTVAELLRARKTAKSKTEDVDKEKQLDEVDKKLQQMLFKSKPKKDKEPAKEAVKSEEQIAGVPDTEPAEEKPAPVKAPAKKPVTRDRAAELRERELELDKERLALERERLEMDRDKAKPAQEQEQDLSGLSSDERYEMEVYRAMDKTAGTKKAEEFLGIARATAKYKAKWEKEHPGDSFDPDDSEHDSFFSSNKFEYDKKDFKKAELRLANEGQEDPKFKELEKSNLELRAKDKLRELEPQIAQTWAKYADAMVEAIDPEIVKVTRAGGAKAGEALLKEFPEEGKEIIAAAQALEVLAREAFKILEGDGMFIPDESGNRAHARILGIIRQQERVIPQQPRDERLDGDGRDFATWEKWLSLTPNERANYWHLGAEEVIDIESNTLAGRVKYELDRAMKIAESRQKRVSGVKKQDEDPEPIKEKPPERRSPIASPGAASKTIVDTPAKAHNSEGDGFQKMIRSALFKRSS